MQPYKILLIDDEEIIRERISKLLDLDGYEVITAEDGRLGLESFEKNSPDVVVSDIKMPHMDGIEVLRRIKEKSPGAGVILLTGHGDMESTIEALRIGAFDYLSKPVEYEELAISIRRLLDLQSMERDRKQLQSQLFQSAKLASVGTLAAGIAHELNNPLAVVVAYVEEVLSLLKVPPFDQPKVEEMTRFVEMIGKSSARMQTIVKHMLAYSRQSGSSEGRAIDINEVINNSFLFVKRDYEKLDIAAAFELASGIPHVWGDSGQFESVFVNLMGNSRDAFGSVKDDRKKSVTVTSSLHEDGGVLIVYEDNAGGMSAETVQRIFDPFFTTKDVGKGTGLGMSVTLGIIENAKWMITVQSELGKGSNFTLKFPGHKP